MIPFTQGEQVSTCVYVKSLYGEAWKGFCLQVDEAVVNEQNCGTGAAHLCLSERINLCLSLLLFAALFKKDRSPLEHQYALLVASVSHCQNNPYNNNITKNYNSKYDNSNYQNIFCSKQ